MSSGARAGVWKGRMIHADVFYINGAWGCFFNCLIHVLWFERFIVLQSACGYDEVARQLQESQKQGNTMKNKSWHRRVPYKYTGCLAHVEIMERSSNSEISRVMEYFLHNEGCREAVLTQLPAIPLHEHVYEVALNHLEGGARYIIYLLFSTQLELTDSTMQHFCHSDSQPWDDWELFLPRHAWTGSIDCKCAIPTPSLW